MDCSPFFRIGLLVLAAMIATPIVSAATVQISGPTVISSPGTYVLTKDISSASTPIKIQCSDVVFDGNGHTIDGVDGGSTYGVQVFSGGTLNRVTVKNLRITDYYCGIYFRGVNGGRIESVTATSNVQDGIYLNNANDNVISACTANGNDQHGIRFWSMCSRNRIESCTLSNNADTGLWLASTGRDPNQYDKITYDSEGNQVVGNTATGNGRMGLYVDFSERNTLSNNRVSDNAGFQIFLDYSGSNRVESNTVSGGTEQGVYLYDADSRTISGNTVSGAADYGLYISSTSGLTISGNTLTRNGVGGIALNGEARSRPMETESSRTPSATTDSTGSSSAGRAATPSRTTSSRTPSTSCTAAVCGASTWSSQAQPGSSIVGGPTLGGNFWGTPSGSGFSETAADANRDGFCDRAFVINSGNSDLLPLARAAGAGTATPTPTPSTTTTSTVSPNTHTDVNALVHPLADRHRHASGSAGPVPRGAHPALHGRGRAVRHRRRRSRVPTTMSPGTSGPTPPSVPARAWTSTPKAESPTSGTPAPASTEDSVDTASACSFSLALRAANPDPTREGREGLSRRRLRRAGVGRPNRRLGDLSGLPCIRSHRRPRGPPRRDHSVRGSRPDQPGPDRLLGRRSNHDDADARTDDDRVHDRSHAPADRPSFGHTDGDADCQTRVAEQHVPALPGSTSAPRDADGNGRDEDVNGNGRTDFNDVTLLFNNLNTVVSAYPAQAFDFNGNTRVDYADVTVLYGQPLRAPFTFIYYGSLPLS